MRYDVIVTLGFSVEAGSESEAERKARKFFKILGGTPVVDIDVGKAEEDKEG